MRAPLSWLKEFVPIRLAAHELAERLTIAGINVENVLSVDFPPTVVVGEVLEVKQHPNADRLKVTQVATGKGQPRQIVCGAPNVAKGQRVAVALPGTTLPNGQSISEATIRGVASSGMLCAADELGIGEDHAGILVLPDSAMIGKPAASALGADDVVFHLEITPNRADCLSMLGTAREVAAVTKAKLRVPKYERSDRGRLAEKVLRVRVERAADCPFYAARVIEGVHIQPSPDSIQSRLRAVGIRPINNVIDITNYVMLELGQPLHAFDADAIGGNRLTVRRARKGESLKALDGKTYSLDSNTLVIASDKAPLALGGVMGGEISGIHQGTTRVVLEAAVFAPELVRATSKKLALSSESSYRFERGVNPHMTLAALDQAATLLEKLAKAKSLRGRVTVGSLPKTSRPVVFSTERMNEMLNLSLSATVVRKLLVGDGMSVAGSGNTLRVMPPHWRKDITIEEDLIEEVGRLYGYPKLSRTFVRGDLRPLPLPPLFVLQESAGKFLAGAGGYEMKNYPFYDRQLAQGFSLNIKDHVLVRNPLSREQELLRLTLLPLLLKKASAAQREENVLFFYEIGRCFRETGKPLPDESERLALVASGPDAYRRLKGIIDQMLARLGIPTTSVQWSSLPPETGEGQDLLCQGKRLGRCLQLPLGVRSFFKFREATAAAELHLAPLVALTKTRAYEAPSAFPSVLRDLAFWIPTEVTYEAIDRLLSKIDPLLRDAKLFDVFEKGGQRSLAFHLVFQSAERTLTAGEVEKVLEKLRTQLTQNYSAKIRQA